MVLDQERLGGAFVAMAVVVVRQPDNKACARSNEMNTDERIFGEPGRSSEGSLCV